jgi:methanogenic corrinoid protein MtbC1
MSAPEAAATAAALLVNERAPALAEALVEREFAARPELAARFGPQGRAKSLQDARYHFAFLALALEFGRPEIFSSYMAWVKTVLAHRRVPPEVLEHHLAHMADVVEDALPQAEARAAAQCIRDAADRVRLAPDSLDAQLGQLSPLAQRYVQLLLANDDPGARALVLEEIRRGMGAGELYLQVLAPALHEVGRLWQANRISVAQEHYCTGVTQKIMAEVSASVQAVRARRTAVVACVAGEQHAIGSRMVADFLDMTGWRTLWLGASTPSTDLLRMVVDLKAELLALSCTYAPHLHEVAALVSALRALPETKDVKVLVGGTAFGWGEDLWRAVGADAFAADAAQAAQAAQRLVTSN